MQSLFSKLLLGLENHIVGVKPPCICVFVFFDSVVKSAYVFLHTQNFYTNFAHLSVLFYISLKVNAATYLCLSLSNSLSLLVYVREYQVIITYLVCLSMFISNPVQGPDIVKLSLLLIHLHKYAKAARM